jgi:hypothetical protein
MVKGGAHMLRRRPFALVLIAALGLSACLTPTPEGDPPAPTPTLTPAATDTQPPATATLPPTETTATTATTEPTATVEPTSELTPTPNIPPPDPVRVVFQAGDGTELVGYYYPAAVENAPLIVLMHQARDNQQRWVSVGLVPWLQNWGLPGMAQGFAEIYPPLPEDWSFAVFTFDFRLHGESARGPLTDGREWLDDARTAVDTARSQPGVDPNRVGLAGASIGADAAVDVCAEGCLGALSFSPGSYLGEVYTNTVNLLDQRGIPAWCLAARGDREADPTCASASGEHYRHVSFEGDDHGAALLKPDQAPPIGPIILEWLELVFTR